MTYSARRFFARNLASALLAGDWEPGGMRDRARRAWGRRSKWLIGLASRAHAQLPAPPPPPRVCPHKTPGPPVPNPKECVPPGRG